MMKTLMILCLFLFGVANTSHSNLDSLENAYFSHSIERLDSFFQKWNKSIQPMDEKGIQKLNDTLRNVYNVFRLFYKPLGIDTLGGSEWGTDIYKDVKYILVQNSIYIYFKDKVYYTDKELEEYAINYIKENYPNDTMLSRYTKEGSSEKLPHYLIERFSPDRPFSGDHSEKLVDSIMDFRPVVSCGDKIPLYLNDKYDSTLKVFLGDEHYNLGEKSLMTPAMAKGESERRKKFLEHYIRIWYGHWGGYWQIVTYPQAYSVVFDKDMKYAKVNFRVVYEGGQAILKSENGKWTLISSKRTWIE